MFPVHSCHDGPASAHPIGTTLPFYSTTWGSVISRPPGLMSRFCRKLDPLGYNPLVHVQSHFPMLKGQCRDVYQLYVVTLDGASSETWRQIEPISAPI